MDKLIKKYSEECSFKSKMSNKIWKCTSIIGLIVLILLVVTQNICPHILLLIAIGTISRYICEFINIKQMTLRLGRKYDFKSFIAHQYEYKEYIYSEMDKFQKNWITNYCKRNKLDRIDKLKVLREEVKQVSLDEHIKYINPAIIGGLAIVIWESFILDFIKAIDTSIAIIIALVLIVIISFFITWVEKETKENVRFFNMFDKWSGYERLNQLLLYMMLKCNK